MTRHYVDITGISDSDLEMLGYYVEAKGSNFTLYVNKGEAFIVHTKGGKRCLYVEDVNDAAILRDRPKILAPPAG